MYNESCNCNSCMQERYNTAQSGFGQGLGQGMNGMINQVSMHIEPYRSPESLQLEAIKELVSAVRELTRALTRPKTNIGPM